MLVAMKPGDHPEFFRLAPPEGRSRESTIRLDSEGRFFHEGEPVKHARLEAAMHTWIARHPDDGRFILNNGYDWTYFTVEDAPYFVRAVRSQGGHPLLLLLLSDGTEEAWDPRTTRIAASGAMYAKVHGGHFEAKFTRHAQNALAPLLVESAGEPALLLDGEVVPIGPSPG
jgi:hypothetical protein